MRYFVKVVKRYDKLYLPDVAVHGDHIIFNNVKISECVYSFFKNRGFDVSMIRNALLLDDCMSLHTGVDSYIEFPTNIYKIVK